MGLGTVPFGLSSGSPGTLGGCGCSSIAAQGDWAGSGDCGECRGSREGEQDPACALGSLHPAMSGHSPWVSVLPRRAPSCVSSLASLSNLPIPRLRWCLLGLTPQRHGPKLSVVGEPQAARVHGSGRQPDPERGTLAVLGVPSPAWQPAWKQSGPDLAVTKPSSNLRVEAELVTPPWLGVPSAPELRTEPGGSSGRFLVADGAWAGHGTAAGGCRAPYPALAEASWWLGLLPCHTNLQAGVCCAFLG